MGCTPDSEYELAAAWIGQGHPLVYRDPEGNEVGFGGAPPGGEG